MIVAFKHKEHDDDNIDLLISTVTASNFIHAQIIFSNGLIGSSWMDTGVSLRTIDKVMIYPSLYTYVIIPVQIEVEGKNNTSTSIGNHIINENLVYEFFLNNLGKPFDMKGAMLLSIFPISRNKNKYHCSEVCIEALKYGGMKTKYNSIPSESISPGKLFKILTPNIKY